jgi:hypothetical protein
MPVPLPTASDTLLAPPSDAEVTLVWRGLNTAVGGGPAGQTPLQQVLLAAVTRAMMGREELPPDPAAITPAEFAEGLARRNQVFRERVGQVMMLGALVRRPPAIGDMARISEFLVELSLDSQLLEITSSYADGGFDLAVVDFDRNGYLGERHFDAEKAALGTSPLVDTAWAAVHDDAALAARWASLGELPREAVGRRVHDFYKTRGFRFPGDPDSAPPLLAQHDWVHVLADYGTSLESELEVFGFIARANDDLRAFSLLAMVVSLFETGIARTGLGLFEANTGNLSKRGMAQRLADALRRGAMTSGSQDFLEKDWFAVADRPVDVIRREVGLVAKDPAVIGLGSAGPWERGGLSAYQRQAGRALAAAEGLDYEALRAPEPLPG